MAQCKCNLIIDSCCDLPFDLVNREGVEILSFPYIMSDGEHADDLYRAMTAHEFYESMRNGEQPSTAQIAVTVFQDAFARAAQSGVPTVYLSFTSGLSGSFNTALLVRDQVMAEYPDAELYVVDTLQASVAEGFLVYEAMRQREKGLTARELAKWAEEARFFVDAQFMVDDLEALRRGGRIPSSVAKAGAALDVKPLLNIAVDGTLALSGVARGRKKGIKQLVEYYEKRVKRSGSEAQPVVIAGADCPKDVERLKEQLEKADGNILFVETNVGPVIGSHVGPGMIALVFWGDDRREDLSVADRIARRVRSE
ncbi:MAG: DegV family protein [Eggerthellaceae bacterium]|nr:DegV family protein [Eggerthellaceae bacterium]